MSKPLVIAASKGYLWKETLPLFDSMGIHFDEDLDSRKLSFWDTQNRYQILMVRPWDVPVYVEQGAADIGIAGKDVILEHASVHTELLDLKFGGCRLVIAGPEKISIKDMKHNINVATKYPSSCIQYFQGLGLKVNPIKLYGAIELAPLTGLSDYICDLTATGTTLKENGLEIIDTVFESTARLIANPMSMNYQYKGITALYEQFKDVCDQ